jgi:hypothetical protein
MISGNDASKAPPIAPDPLMAASARQHRVAIGDEAVMP